nr:uncharacterized protein LOC124493875 [Dermatophagoides farinae]
MAKFEFKESISVMTYGVYDLICIIIYPTQYIGYIEMNVRMRALRLFCFHFSCGKHLKRKLLDSIMELDPNDDLYQQFINSFQQSDLDRLFADDDDDPNDQDYNVYQDVCNIDDFKEFLDFFDETFKNTPATDNGKEPSQTKLIDQTKSDCDKQQHSFSNNQLEILYHQLSFHTQLLTQDWILSIRYDDDDDNKIQNGYRKMLEELNELSLKNDRNVLRLIRNLEPAIQLIEHDGDDIVEKERNSNFGTVLTSQLKSFLIKHRDIFPFGWALPSRPFLSRNKSTQTIFTEADDHLIAFGFEKFFLSNRKSTRNNSVYKYIHNNLLPIHSEHSICHHVKYLKLMKIKKINQQLIDPQKYDKWFTNPIVYYFRENKLLPFNRYFSKENLSNIYHLYPLPDWYQKYMDKDDSINPILYIDDSRKNNNNDQHCNEQQKAKSTTSLSPSSSSKYQTIVPKPDSNGNLPIFALPGQQTIYADGTIIQNILTNQSYSFHTIASLTPKRIYRKSNHYKSSKNDEHSMISKPLQICPSTQESLEANWPVENDEIISDIVPNQPEIPASRASPKISADENCDDYAEFEDIEIDDNNNDDVEIDKVDDEHDHAKNVVEEEDEEDDEEEIEDEDVDDDGDDEEDLMALMEASWTTVANSQHGKQPQQRSHQDQDDVGRINRRKSELLALQRESSRYIIEHSTGGASSNIDSINDRLISYYLKRSRKLLVYDEDYFRFLELISNFNDQPYSHEKMYNQLREFLFEIRCKYAEQHADNAVLRQQVLDGFDELIELLLLLVLFSIDRSDSNHYLMNNRSTFEYLHWQRTLEFFRKLELYLSFVYDGHPNQQQNCVQKMIRLLNQSLSQHKHTSSEQRTKIKTSVSKILSNHPLLMKEFSSLFLEDSPSDHLYSDAEDFDEFTIPTDIEMDTDVVVVVDDDELSIENCTIPIDPNDSKYGTNECPCRECHHQTTETTTTTAANNHCTMCSIRFISGRIYLPQISTNSKRLQLVEYVHQRHQQQSSSSPLRTNKLDWNKLTVQTPAWTLEEDRILLQTCRSMIVDFNITKLTESIIDRLAIKLANENVFNQKRTFTDIAERLRHLIEILTC